MHEVPHELSNDLETEKILAKSQNRTYSLVPNLPCKNKNLAITLKYWTKSAIKLSMKHRLHFSNSFISILWNILVPTTDLKTHKKLRIINNITLKLSIRPSFFKIGSKKSLLGKLLIDYTSSTVPSTSIIIARALNVSNCSTSAGSISIQAET